MTNDREAFSRAALYEKATSVRQSLVTSSKKALADHREVARGSVMPAPKAGPAPTFFHGFMLPFSLVFATLRHRSLGLTYLKVTCVRALVVALVANVAVATSHGPRDQHRPEPRLVVLKKDGVTVKELGSDTPLRKGLTVRASGVELNLPVFERDRRANEEADDADEATVHEAVPPRPVGIWARLKGSWTWLLWIIGLLSLSEAIVMAVSRRWDDWLAFHASALAQTAPEDPVPTVPKLTFFDGKWLWKKLKRRIRGYVVVGVGIPFFLSFKLVPGVGGILATIGITAWSWYWLMIFAASKSGHAWVDDGRAPPPFLIREIEARVPPVRWFAPARHYVRLWAWVTRGVNAPAMVTERAPAAFAGLALARMILSLPGLYLLARPLIPVAAGRLCAEIDPYDRFSLRAQAVPASVPASVREAA